MSRFWLPQRIAAIYIVLGILYESYMHPITILSTLPSAGVGALLALLLTGNELNVMGLIGILLLMGIVKKNAIMMIDFALEAERKENMSSEEAIYTACVLRFRPIMMTTLAALFGGLPLALGTGAGSELRRPMGIAIVGGLLVSQALTLFTTPVIYLYLDRFRLWMLERRGVPVHHSTNPALPAASEPKSDLKKGQGKPRSDDPLPRLCHEPLCCFSKLSPRISLVARRGPC